MRAKNEDLCLAAKTTPDDHYVGFCKELRISYTRDFLISLAELDICRELPRGFDNSILRELVDRSTNFSRPCNDSEPGRFGGNPGPLLQNPEHGLLGSGTFPRISRYSDGTSSPLLQGCGFHLLNRSSEPYRPPHLCKAKPPRRESNDQYNDETFGSSENLSQERVDEERRRRDSFDLMRKEQERAIQEKKRIISGEHEESINPETTIFLEDAGGDARLTNKYCNLKEFELSLAPNSDTEGCKTTWITSSTQILPGFTSKSLEYDLNSSSTSHPSIQHELSDVKEDHAKNHASHSCDLSHEEGIITEESILSEHNGQYSAQIHSPTDWDSYPREDSQSGSFKTHAASQCLISFPQKRMGLSEVAGSLKLRNESSDEFYVSETGNDSGHLNIVNEGHTRSFEKVPFSPIIGRMVLPKNLTESSSIQRAQRYSVTRNDILAPFVSPLLTEDKYMTLSRINEPSVETNFEGTMYPAFIKPADLSKTEGGQSVCDTKARQELDLWNESASKHSPISDSAEFDNICLPDEDSLIRVDDTVFPWEPLTEDTSGSPVAIAEEQAVFGVTLSDNRTQDLASLNTSFQNFCIQQSYPQVCHPRLNPGNAYFHHLSSQQVQQNSKNKVPNLRPYRWKPHYRQSFPPALHFDPIQCAYPTAPTLHSVNHPLKTEMPIPGEFHPYQYGLPKGVSAPNKVAFHANESMLYSLQNYHQHHYMDLEMPFTDHIVGLNSNQPAISELFEMDLAARQAHPHLSKAGDFSGMFGNHVYMQF
ncbi:hypothetical protein SLEP1_g39935 [Rubroshorea leprosula]|uniref:Uncharacterized protein n=1 Tax=Rubroshorea leprosula TaxID=152421 RepID=A0AAV5L2B4_9ROSI|nr:hypothetical protein SLEP1_g39935 [Rubroshorea leprosula]